MGKKFKNTLSNFFVKDSNDKSYFGYNLFLKK